MLKMHEFKLIVQRKECALVSYLLKNKQKKQEPQKSIMNQCSLIPCAKLLLKIIFFVV